MTQSRTDCYSEPRDELMPQTAPGHRRRPRIKACFRRSGRTFGGPPWPQRRSLHHLELDLARVAEPLGRIQDLNQDQVTVRIVAEDYNRLVLIALHDIDIRPQKC